MELETVLIGSLNDLVFCSRRFALHQIEGIWADNQHTVLGTLLHEQADEPGYETEAGVKIIRALPLFSKKYGLSGKADVVEVHDGKPFPIEYKKGKRRKFENDDVQLCAQALCLEEMFSAVIPEGAIYHASSKRRRVVELNEHLRDETMRIIDSARELLNGTEIPPAVYSPRCEECSLLAHCLPALTGKEFHKKLSVYFRSLWEK